MNNTISLVLRKLQTLTQQIPLLPRVFQLIWQAAPSKTLLWLLLLVLQGILPATLVYLTRTLVNTVASTLDGTASWITFQPVFWLVALMAGLMLLSEGLGSLSSYVRVGQAEFVQDHIARLIHQKSIQVDMAFYDSPDYYNRLHRAQYQAIDRPLALLENMGKLLQNGLTLLAMAALLIPYSIWLPILLVGSSLPAFVVVFQQRLRLHHWHIRNTEAERRTWYYRWLLTDRTVAAELRLFGLGGHFQSLYESIRLPLRAERISLALRQNLAELGASAMALGITGLTLGWMLWRTIAGALTLGDLALFYQAFTQSQKVVRVLLDTLGSIYTDSLFLKELFDFLALEPNVVDTAYPTGVAPRLEENIRFENVSFQYPGSEKLILRNFALELQSGKVVAVVGVNGAGKSTLMKLLCRLYDPTEGQIFLDGVNLKEIELASLRRCFTVMFQQPVQYNNSAAENITLGDLAKPLSAEAIKAAAHAAGADQPIEQLAEGYDSLLGRWFAGGSELSVGQWQRLALARAYWRQAPILILDEPTSAMDPWAEHDWLQRFRALADGRTALIITHRFTTAMYADVIHVMEEGQIVESGNHNELLRLGGRYATSWATQMRTQTGGHSGAEERRRVIVPS